MALINAQFYKKEFNFISPWKNKEIKIDNGTKMKTFFITVCGMPF
jgi:hypothetical protein